MLLAPGYVSPLQPLDGLGMLISLSSRGECGMMIRTAALHVPAFHEAGPSIYMFKGVYFCETLWLKAI